MADEVNRTRVLVVDDSHDNLQALAEILRDLGCEVEVAYNGELALPLVHASKPHCVIFDMDMPVMDGHALAQTLRTYFRDEVVLIGMSGHAESEPRVAAVLPLVDHWFAKPIDIAALEAVISRLGMSLPVAAQTPGPR